MQPGPEGNLPVRPQRRRSPQAYDIATVVLLLLGGVVVPVIGWFAGVVLLWASPRWSIRDKLLGTAVVPLGLGAPVWSLLWGIPMTLLDSCSVVEFEGRVVQDTCGGGWAPPVWVLVGLLAVMTVAPVITAVVLLRRAGRADRHDLRPA